MFTPYVTGIGNSSYTLRTWRGLNTTLAEYVARSGVEGFHSVGIARWVVAGCDQEWPVVLLADWAVVVGR